MTQRRGDATFWDWRLCVLWTVSSVLGTVVTWLLLGRWYASIYSFVHGPPQGAGIPVYPDALVLLACGGGLTGLGQWLALWRSVSLSKESALWWILGSALSGLVPLGLVADTTDTGVILMLSGVVAAILGCLGGMIQCIALMHAFRWPGLWIVVSTMTGAIGWPLGAYLGSLVWGPEDGGFGGYVGSWVLSGVIVAGLVCWLRPRVSGVDNA